MKNFVRVLVASAAIALFSGCAQHKQTAAPATLNKVCVISHEALEADSPTVDYMGGKVGFCCNKCLAKWEKMSDAEKKAALDKAKM